MRTWEYLQILVKTNQGAPEYWTVDVEGSRWEWGRALESYGKEGWELVNLVQSGVNMAPASIEFVAIFKRSDVQLDLD